MVRVAATSRKHGVCFGPCFQVWVFLLREQMVLAASTDGRRWTFFANSGVGAWRAFGRKLTFLITWLSFGGLGSPSAKTTCGPSHKNHHNVCPLSTTHRSPPSSLPPAPPQSLYNQYATPTLRQRPVDQHTQTTKKTPFSPPPTAPFPSLPHTPHPHLPLTHIWPQTRYCPSWEVRTPLKAAQSHPLKAIVC